MGLVAFLRAVNTHLGWVLSGTIKFYGPQQQAISYFSSLITGDESIQKFWEVENCHFRSPPLSMEEQAVVKHFNTHYSRDHAGWFIVPLPQV